MNSCNIRSNKRAFCFLWYGNQGMVDMWDGNGGLAAQNEASVIIGLQ